MATPVKKTPEIVATESSLVTVQLKSLADVTVHLGARCHIDFVAGAAIVHADIAERLRLAGYID